MVYVNSIHKQISILEVHGNRGLVFLAFTVYLVGLIFVCCNISFNTLAYFNVTRKESERVCENSETSADREIKSTLNF